MYKCTDCKKTFFTPEIVKENRMPIGDTPAYERVPICPCCKSVNFYSIPNYEELLDAMDTISNYCSKIDYCEDCIFYKRDEGCSFLANSPSRWGEQ